MTEREQLAAVERQLAALERSVADAVRRLDVAMQTGTPSDFEAITRHLAFTAGIKREHAPGPAAYMAPEQAPIAMRLTCPECGELHIDEGEFATKSHHTHACQCCGMVWRPAIVATVGVRFLPGFKNETELDELKATVAEIKATAAKLTGGAQ